MLFSRRLTSWLQFVLLLVTVACQRASFPTATAGGYAPELVPQGVAAPSLTTPPIAPPAVGLDTPVPAQQLKVMWPARLGQRRLVVGQRTMPKRPAVSAAAATQAVPAHPQARPLRKTRVMNENSLYALIFFGAGALFAAGGLALAIGVGGGWAVAGGVVLILIGVLLALFWLYARALGRNMRH